MPNTPLIAPRVPLTDPRTGLISREWYRFLTEQEKLTGGAALTKVDDSNVTLTLGGYPGNALLRSVSLTLGWQGLLPISRGGTGADTPEEARAALGAASTDEVTSGDAATLAAAEAYADAQASVAQTAAEAHADAGDTATLAAAEAYADTGLTGKSDVGHTHIESEIIGLTADLADKAPSASPTFTGVPTAPTPSAGDNSTKIATTAYVDNAISSTSHGIPVGGTAGQVLTKNSSTDYDTSWADPATGSTAQPNASIRQTVHSGSTDANGFANFLSAGSGLSVNVSATSVPLVIAFAAGFDSATPYGPKDYFGRVTADTTISSLPASSTVYLYAERNASTGAVTFGYTTTAPIYSPISPATAGASVVPNMTSNTAPSPYVASASSYYVNDAQYAPWKLYNGVINDGFGWVTQKSLGFPQWNKIDLGSAVTISTYTLYGNSAAFTTAPTAWSVEGSNTGAFTGEQTLLDSRSGQTAWTTAGLTFNIATPGSYRYYRLVITANNGHATETDVTEWVLSSSGMTLTSPWFDTNAMVMWAPGTPAVAKQRVYIGEATTGASTVTSVTTYALKGYYDSGWFAVAVSTNYTKSHNIGIAAPEGLSVSYFYSPTGANSDAGVAYSVFTSSTNLVGHFMREATTQDSRVGLKFGFTNQIQSYAGSGRTSGYYRIIAKRLW